MSKDKLNTTRSNQEESSSASSEKVYLLIDGQSAGPYTREEVTQKITANVVLITDSISVNGHDWFKLYDWSGFDRRSGQREELPGTPKVNLFNSSDIEVAANLKKKNETCTETEAIAGLAYLGHLKSGKSTQFNDEAIKTKSEPVQDSPPSFPELDPLVIQKKPNKSYLWGAALSFALFGILYLALAPAPRPILAAKKIKSVKIKNKSITKIKAVSPRSRSFKKKKIVKAKTRVKSFAKSKAFQNRKSRRPASRAKAIKRPVVEDPDDYYYDNGTDPVELDPIRSKLAKETFDPDDAAIDHYLDDLDAEREPASENEFEEDPEKAFEALYE